MKTINIERIEAISPVFAEKVGCLSAARNARVEGKIGDTVAVVLMDDAGHGEYSRNVSTSLADELVAQGIVVDARA